MILLSAVIITYNEEKKIERCLRSLLGVADEIVVVDSYSTDRTEEICKRYDVKFVKKAFLGYVEQKNFAITQTSHDHIISLDADEALSDKLKESLLNLKSDWKCDGYYMNRYNNYCGQWINHSDWYPEKKLRAFIKGKGEWKGLNPHDSFQVYDQKSTQWIKGDLLHCNYLSYSEHNKQIERFSSISAQSYYEKGKKAPFWKIFFNPWWAFFKAYFLRLGFLDGFNGFVISVQTAHLTFLKYIKLRALLKKYK